MQNPNLSKLFFKKVKKKVVSNNTNNNNKVCVGKKFVVKGSIPVIYKF